MRPSCGIQYEETDSPGTGRYGRWRAAHRTRGPTTAIRRARAEVRERMWTWAGSAAQEVVGEVIVDLDGVLGRVYSEERYRQNLEED